MAGVNNFNLQPRKMDGQTTVIVLAVCAADDPGGGPLR